MTLPTREEIADILARAIHGHPLNTLHKPEVYEKAADALLARLGLAWEQRDVPTGAVMSGGVVNWEKAFRYSQQSLRDIKVESDALRADLERCKAALAKANPAGEQWRPIKGFEERYEVSDLGRVRSLPRPRIPNARILTPMRNKDGYDHVMFRKGKKCHHFFIQRLVLEAFVGPCPPGHEAAHQDGNPVNCALTNLRWATHIENAHQKNEHGTVYRRCPSCGERHKSGQCAALARPGVREAMK